LTAGPTSDASEKHVHTLTSIMGKTLAADRLTHIRADIQSAEFTETNGSGSSITDGLYTTDYNSSAATNDSGSVSETAAFSSSVFDGWDGSWNAFWQAGLASNTDKANAVAFLGLGIGVISTSVVPSSAVSTARHAGFFVHVSSGTVTVYASNSDGTTQTRTDITALISTLVGTMNAFSIEYTASSIVFKFNNVAVATHTTNLPTGITDFGLAHGVTSKDGSGAAGRTLRMFRWIDLFAKLAT
jgi:hypothetical protein